MASLINTEQRVGIFLDIQNLYHSAKNLHGSRVNYKELIKYAAAGRHVVRTIAYVVSSDPQTGEEAFFGALEKEGIELRMKDLQIYSSGAKKADWDVGMAVDAIRLAPSLDVVVLATGDGDFIPLVEYLKIGMGKIVEVVAFGRTTSSKMKEEVDRFIDVDDIPKAVFKSERSRRSVSASLRRDGTSRAIKK
ncbi:MAG: NYN domain-containing protein [Parcubacteria group bacterium]